MSTIKSMVRDFGGELIAEHCGLCFSNLRSVITPNKNGMPTSEREKEGERSKQKQKKKTVWSTTKKSSLVIIIKQQWRTANSRNSISNSDHRNKSELNNIL